MPKVQSSVSSQWSAVELANALLDGISPKDWFKRRQVGQVEQALVDLGLERYRPSYPNKPGISDYTFGPFYVRGLMPSSLAIRVYKPPAVSAEHIDLLHIYSVYFGTIASTGINASEGLAVLKAFLSKLPTTVPENENQLSSVEEIQKSWNELARQLKLRSA